MKLTSSSAETFDELAPWQVLGGFALGKTLATMAHGDLLTDAKYIINTAQTTAYRSVNAALVYRNWYLGKRIAEEVLKGEGDNPTLGILLCANTDADIARYSILKGNEQLFATKYVLCLPSDEELRAEIETQKQIYFEQFANSQKGGLK